MGRWANMAEKVIKKTIGTPTELTEHIRCVEAAGTMVNDPIDDDDHLYQRLTSDRGRSLSGPTRSRMQTVSPYLWQTNLIANRLIELPLAYLLAEGLSFNNPDKQYQEVLKRFWLHPINNMDIKLEKKVRELAIFGEQFYPTFVNPMTGEVQLSHLDPAKVDEVMYDPRNPEQPIGVKTVRMDNNRVYRYKVIINGPESVFTRQTQRLRAGFTDGELFYFSVNSFCCHGRGHGDLTAQADYLDLYDEFIFGEGDRAEQLRAFVWDVTLKEADGEAVEKRAKEIAENPPRPGAVNVHNDSEIWEAKSSDLHSGDTEALAKLFRNHMLAGSSMPPSWFADGTDVNRANGEAMAEPTLKILAMRQRYIKYLLKEVLTYVLRQHERARSQTEATRESHPDVFDTVIDFPEMTAKDISRYASALQQVVVAVNLSMTQGIMTEETGLAVIAAIAERLGVEIDPAAELEQAKKQQTEAKDAQQQEDSFSGPDFNSAEEEINDE